MDMPALTSDSCTCHDALNPVRWGLQLHCLFFSKRLPELCLHFIDERTDLATCGGEILGTQGCKGALEFCLEALASTEGLTYHEAEEVAELHLRPVHDYV